MLLLEKINFSLKASHSLSCPSLLVWNLAYVSLEISIQLFFFLFLFSVYSCSADPCIVCVVSGRWNQSSAVLFYVVFESSWQCIDAFLLFFLLFSTHVAWQNHLLDVWAYASLIVFLFSGPFIEVLPLSLSRIVPSILQGDTAQEFIPLMRFLLYSLLSSSFLTLRCSF